MEPSLIKISKFLSLVLRHHPESIHLQLDPEGWAFIPELMKKAPFPLTREQLLATVRTNDKQRFALSSDGDFIRANQGHSIKVNLGLQAVAPPPLLFHGTARHFLGSICEKGILPQNRQYVHLSKDQETAQKVGMRHGKPVILQIPASDLHEQGTPFFLAQNGIWLTTHIAPGQFQEI